MSSTSRECPFCGEDILATAKKCKHCGEFLDKSVKKDQQPKQGALTGALVCLGLGLYLMYATLWSFLIYSPLFFAAFILSIVAMAQKRVFWGVIIFIATIALPLLFFMILGASRVSEGLDSSASDTNSSQPLNINKE